MSNDVATPLLAHSEAAKVWRKTRALMGGTRAMREAGQTFLPQFDGESDKAYTARLDRSVLTNYYRRAVRNVVSKVFADELLLEDGTYGEQIGQWVEDVDLQGNHLSVFARAVFQDAVEAGVSFVLVDHPPGLEGATLADEREAGLRPYMVHIPAERVIGWRVERVGGTVALTQVRILESVDEPDGDFNVSEIEQIRVIEPDWWRVYRKVNDSGDWAIHEQGPLSLGSVPLFAFYTHQTGEMVGEPPFEDLADLNITHWQSASDQRNILSFARVPMLSATGIEEDSEIVFAPNTVLQSSNENAKFGFVEHSGGAIQAGAADLVALEEAMAVLSLEPILSKAPGDQTATERAINEASSNSQLVAWALGLKDTLENALLAMAQFRGLPDEPVVKPNLQFEEAVGGDADIQRLLELRVAGEISRQTLYTELTRRGLLSDEFDADTEAELLMAEGGENNGNLDEESEEI